MPNLFDPLAFTRGPAMKNRFMLAPLTNMQSHPDGTLSDDEFNWLTRRAAGGFGLTMTCAAHVQARGQGFAGQLGVFADKHLDGLKRLAAEIKKQGSVAVVQLHHAGMRSPAKLIGEQPVSASENDGSRALTTGETEQVAADFIAAAVRCEKAGFDGVELHGAHGYLLCQYLSAETNRREDRYGGGLENRERLLLEIVEGVRAQCGAAFSLGVRLSPERFGLKLQEIRATAQRLMRGGEIDYLDMSLWDVFKTPAEEEFASRPLLSYFTDLERGAVRLGAAGKILSGPQARQCLAAGLDFCVLGTAGILHADFPERVRANPDFVARSLPVTAEYLREQGLGPAFLRYMRKREGWVAPEGAAA